MVRTVTSSHLTQENALIFRVTHRKNVRWALENGLCCSNSESLDPNFVAIGNEDLINARRDTVVKRPPGGTLADYVPFYFTPFSPMLYNIKTGHGIRKRASQELVIFVTSLHQLIDDGVDFVFTDRHAYLANARFFSSVDDLGEIDFAILQNRDFKHDAEDPEKMERYQAEALVHQSLPVSSIRAILCYDDEVRHSVAQEVDASEQDVKILAKPDWYF